MELYEQIRREYEHGAGTIRAVARKPGVHRRGCARHWPARCRPNGRFRNGSGQAGGGNSLYRWDSGERPPGAAEAGHTAHRIFTRLRRERPEVEVAESTVRRYVRERKAAMGLLGRETFVPQSYAWGGEGQVDWYEGRVEFDGERRKPTSSACAVWPAEAPFIGRIRMPTSRLSWKRMSWRLPIWWSFVYGELP